MAKKLGLIFTYGVALKEWEKNGSLNREADIYDNLANFFKEVKWFTYGSKDQDLAKKLPPKIKLFPKIKLRSNFWYSLFLPFIYRKELKDLDIIKTNQMMGVWTAIIIKIIYGKKLIVRTGYTLSLSSLKPKNLLVNIRGKIYKTGVFFLEFLAYKLADHSFVTTKLQHDHLKKMYKLNNLQILPNAINTKIFNEKKRQEDSNLIEFLYVGRLSAEKNLFNLLNAIKEIPNSKITLIGQGSLKEKIIKKIKKEKIKARMIDRVSNKDLPRFYQRADIYIQTSFYEGHPKTILEAMSCGNPIIATEVRGIKDLIKDGETGILCKTDSNSIKMAILKVKSDKKIRGRLGQEARKFILNNFSLSKVIEKEIKTYKNILT